MGEIRATGSEDQCGFDIGDEPREDEREYCHGCGGHLGLRDQLGPEHWWNGWAWCPEHAEEMQRLAQSPDPVNEIRR